MVPGGTCSKLRTTEQKVARMPAPITVFVAKAVRTMNVNIPLATHVAVREGRILAVGTLEDVALWGDYTLDDTFKDKVLMPGFIEAHSHAMEGGAWDKPFLGFFERTDPDGVPAGGYKSIAAVIDALKAMDAAIADPDQPLVCWGYDPIYYDNQRMVAADLDAVSATRPMMIQHASGHLLNVNSALMKLAGITRDTDVEGVMKADDGEPTGELQEMAAMFIARKAIGEDMLGPTDARVFNRYASSARNAGVTTAVDLGNPLTDEGIAILESETARDDFHLRLVSAMWAAAHSLEDGLERAAMLREKGNDKWYPHLVKIMTDGSIQGFTGRIKWPGYFNGAPNGIWNAPPEQLKQAIIAYHKSGAQVHVHVNGDQASELAIDAFEEALKQAPRADHRHTLQHCQMANDEQFRRMKILGLCANLFANHLYYWGDQHYALTMGPDRANRMDACGTALRYGIPLAIHSDVPVTPLAPLFTAWCAVNRLTATGRVLGEAEKITVEQALYAITMGAAFQLNVDHLVGSIEIGKLADFAVLEKDPFEVEPAALKDVPVWGTIVGGISRQSARSLRA